MSPLGRRCAPKKVRGFKSHTLSQYIFNPVAQLAVRTSLRSKLLEVQILSGLPFLESEPLRLGTRLLSDVVDLKNRQGFDYSALRHFL